MGIENIGWSIGSYCNAKCNHCYSWKTRRGNESFLSRNEIDIIIGKLIDYRVKTVNFGGNEPIFTNGKDVSQSVLPYIIKKLSDADVSCGITTNGFTANYLYENHLEAFLSIADWDFSLDSPCAEEHDGNRNLSGAFSGVMKAIDRCSLHKKPYSIVIAGMKTNLDNENLSKFLELAKEVKAELRINFLKPIEKHHFELMPSREQVYCAMDYLLNNTKLITLSEPVLAAQLKLPLQGCPCGDSSFRIRAKVGSRVPVTPCVYMDFDGGDILTESITEIINSPVFNDFVSRKKKLPNACKEKNCELIHECLGGCTARTLLMTGDANSVDPYCPLGSIAKLSAVLTPENSASKQEELKRVRVHENYLCTWIGKPE